MQPESVRYPIFVCEQRTPHGNWRELCHSVCRTRSLHSPTADPIRSDPIRTVDSSAPEPHWLGSATVLWPLQPTVAS
jgi:hypothetical protein